ncbi:MAG TPA: hypothetical protein VFD82_10515 [Planctomycetota bacterium]|nr:hypothetical protein [Planctomycetota bacterium]
MSARFLTAIAVTAGTASAQWAQLSPVTSPPARSAAGMAYDPINNRLMLFGGASVFTQFNDTWTYDGTNWTQQSPAASPPAKHSMDIVFDLSRGVFVMYGGNATFTNPGTNQTWEYDGVTWTQRFPANNPGNLGLHAMAYDSVRNVVVLFGGMPGGNPIVDSNETWEYDGVNWTQRFPATNPGRLEAHSMCFHHGLGKTILFGGVNANPSTPPALIDNDKTWAYDGATWVELAVPGTRPPRRERARLAYDPLRQVCVLVGGMHYSNGQPRSDTWELSQTGAVWTWTQVVTPGLPTNFYRFSSTLAFMFGDRQMVQFGGMRGTSTMYGDTSEYGAKVATFGSGCAGTNGVPALTAADAPRLGQDWVLSVANLNPAINFAVIVLGLTQLPGIDLGPLLGMPGCTGYVMPDVLSSAPVGSSGSTTWTWTAISGPIGAQFFCQALCLDPAANSFGFTISNAVSATLGF